MSGSRKRLTVSVEDYLKAVYALTRDGTPASTSALARALDVQPASVTGMVKRLAESGFLEHLPYKGVRLTRSGMADALRIVRRHRILETYLQTKLGFNWEDVHAEAERLEHAASDALIEKMAAALGDPTHDPHGAPIPTVSGEIEAPVIATLADAPTDTPVRVHAVQDEDAEELRDLANMGLVPGATVTVHPAEGSHGPMTLSVEDGIGDETEETITRELARKVYVGPPGTEDEGVDA